MSTVVGIGVGARVMVFGVSIDAGVIVKKVAKNRCTKMNQKKAPAR